MSTSPARDGAPPPIDLSRLVDLKRRYADLDGSDLLHPLVTREFAGRIAVVSSFGAESVVLLGLVAAIDPGVPVIFLETGKHFTETLAYRDLVCAHLGLRDVRSVRPSSLDLESEDPEGVLWQRDPDRCCYLRKVLPLEKALRGFDAWITGRKRFHGEARQTLEKFELVDGQIKVNPLAAWTETEVSAALAGRGLPRHPLLEEGYRSIGCAPCTVRTLTGEGVRAGRWLGVEKTECGIHKTPWYTES